MFMRNTTVLVAVVMLGSASLLQAQAGQQRPQMHEPAHTMGQGMMCPSMMGGDMHEGMAMMSGAPSPAMILRARDALALTAEQTMRLEAIRAQGAEAAQPHMHQIMAAHERAVQALQSDPPDLSGYESAVGEAAKHMAAMHVAAAKAGLDARAALTAEQRARLTDAVTIVRAMMCGSTGGTMMRQGRGL